MDDMERDMTAAIGAVLSKYERTMPTKWVVLVEVLDERAARALWMITDDESMSWDTKGLLAHALDVQRAKTYRSSPDGEGV